MEKICHGLTGAAPFKVLRKTTVVGCHQLKNLFSFSVARQLQLQEITVENCNNIEEIIDDVEEQGNGNDTVQESEGCKLGSLRSLTLEDLPKLISFNSSNCSNISLFNDKFLFPNLEELQLSRINVDMIWIASYCVENLTKLIIDGCHNLKYLFSSTMARSLVKLGHLEIKNCKLMTKVLSKENEEGKGNLIFLGLKFLQLWDVQNLVSFYGDFAVMSTNTVVAAGIQPLFNKQVVFPNIEELHFSSLKINQLWITSSYAMTFQESLNFRQLKSLRISHCSSLEYLFTPSMVSSLVQLAKLFVASCQDLKQVIMAKGVEELVNTELIFPRLNSITLQFCDKLSSFYAGSYALKFQSTIKIRIEVCLNMITFASKFSTEQEKETTYGGTEGRLGKKEPDLRSQTLFYDTVGIPLLDTLDLCSINVQQIWHNELSSMSSLVQSLRKLTVRDCASLKYLFTSSMVKSFVQLEVLEIYECQLMEVVILIENWEDEEKVRQMAFPKLKVLELMVLPQFIKFCGTCNSLVEISEPQGLMNGSGSQVLSPTS